MYIGELANLSGVTPKAIRHYEEIGILPPPRRKGSYRVYDSSFIEIVKQIKMSQSLGFKLSEFKKFADGANIRWGLSPEIIVNAIGAKREQLKTQIRDIQRTDRQLASLQRELKKSPCFVDSAP